MSRKDLDLRGDMFTTRGAPGFVEDEISGALAYHLRNRGVIIRNHEQFKSLQAFDDRVEVSLESGKVLKSDVLLWANGRTGNTDGLGLETLEITPNRYGQIDVNELALLDLPRTDPFFQVEEHRVRRLVVFKSHGCPDQP